MGRGHISLPKPLPLLGAARLANRPSAAPSPVPQTQDQVSAYAMWERKPMQDIPHIVSNMAESWDASNNYSVPPSVRPEPSTQPESPENPRRERCNNQDGKQQRSG